MTVLNYTGPVTLDSLTIMRRQHELAAGLVSSRVAASVLRRATVAAQLAAATDALSQSGLRAALAAVDTEIAADKAHADDHRKAVTELDRRIAALRAAEAAAERPSALPVVGQASSAAVDTLGLDAPLTLKALKARYRELAKLYHPDTNDGDPAAAERFRAIDAAYRFLLASLGLPEPETQIA